MKEKSTNAAFGLPYSTVHQAGDFYFISGHTGVDTLTKTAGSDIKAQTNKVFENLIVTMETYGLELNDIVKTTIFITDMGDFAAVNERT